MRDLRGFCQAGSCEPIKAGIHATLGVLAAVCLAYNIAAFGYRKRVHLARNVVLYGALVALEIAQVRRHLR